MYSIILDYFYCVKVLKMNIFNAMIKIESEVNFEEQLFVKLFDIIFKIVIFFRKFVRILLRRDFEGELKVESEGVFLSVGFVGVVYFGIVQFGFVGVVYFGIVQFEYVGVGRGRGRGRKSLIFEEIFVNIRFVLLEFEVISF